MNVMPDLVFITYFSSSASYLKTYDLMTYDILKTKPKFTSRLNLEKQEYDK